jgi:2-polyprenyl-3-methyl-5-hydroxy-6-metoxy-1,4-benzoquinol methylase
MRIPTDTRTQRTLRFMRESGVFVDRWLEETTQGPLSAFYEEQIAWVLSHGPWTGRTVLEIGSGYGRFSKALQVAGAEVVAFDIARDLLVRLPDSLESRVQGDSGKLPFRNATFDTVVIMEVLMHLPHWRAVLHEIARVTRPDGVLHLQFNNAWGMTGLGFAIPRIVRWLMPGETAFHRFHTEASVRRCLGELGYQIVDRYGQGFLTSESTIRLTSAREIYVVRSDQNIWLRDHMDSWARRLHLPMTKVLLTAQNINPVLI